MAAAARVAVVAVAGAVDAQAAAGMAVVAAAVDDRADPAARAARLGAEY